MDNQTRVALVRVGKPFSSDISPAVKYHLGDHLGSSSVVIDDTGGWVNREEYTPYGETSLGSFAKKQYRFTSNERDDESRLTYHRTRYYAPWLARWVSVDRVNAKDGINGFLYVSKNPLRFIDPSGEDAQRPQGYLATAPAQQSFSKGSERLIGRWDSLTPAQRQTSILGLVNNALAGGQVPVPPLSPVTYEGNAEAFFDESTWGIAIKPDFLRQSRAQLAEGGFSLENLLSGAFHEARHAEQRFLSARFLAGQGLSSAAIAAELNIPGNVSQRALSQPLASTSSLGRWAHDFYLQAFCRGNGAAAAMQRIEDLRDETKSEQSTAQAAQEKVLNDPASTAIDVLNATNRLDIARQSRKVAYDIYVYTAKERDARLAQIGVAARLGIPSDTLLLIWGFREATGK